MPVAAQQQRTTRVETPIEARSPEDLKAINALLAKFGDALFINHNYERSGISSAREKNREQLKEALENKWKENGLSGPYTLGMNWDTPRSGKWEVRQLPYPMTQEQLQQVKDTTTFIIAARVEPLCRNNKTINKAKKLIQKCDEQLLEIYIKECPNNILNDAQKKDILSVIKKTDNLDTPPKTPFYPSYNRAEEFYHAAHALQNLKSVCNRTGNQKAFNTAKGCVEDYIKDLPARDRHHIHCHLANGNMPSIKDSQLKNEFLALTKVPTLSELYKKFNNPKTNIDNLKTEIKKLGEYASEDLVKEGQDALLSNDYTPYKKAQIQRFLRLLQDANSTDINSTGTPKSARELFKDFKSNNNNNKLSLDTNDYREHANAVLRETESWGQYITPEKVTAYLKQKKNNQDPDQGQITAELDRRQKLLTDFQNSLKREVAN